MATTRTRNLLLSLALVGAVSALTAPGAAAAPMGLEEWLSSTTDSYGVPLEHYQTLPLDRGDLLHPDLQWLAGALSFLWGLHFNAMTTVLWLLQYLLSFEWVSLLTAPIKPMAIQVETMVGDLNWVPFAATVAGLAIGLTFLLGRRSQGWGELVLAVTMVMLATGALMNPVTWITGEDGLLDKSQTFAAEVAVEVTGGDGDTISESGSASAALNATVVSDMSTLLLRHPAQTISFGHLLQGECDEIFTQTTKDTAPMDTKSTDVRDAVGDCDESAKTYVSSPDFFKVAQSVAIGLGMTVVLVLVLVLAVIFMVAVLLALLYGLWQMVAVLIAILPGTSRVSFMRAFFGVLACMAAIIATTVLTAVVVNLLVYALSRTSGLGVVLQMVILFVVTVALIVTLIKVRKNIARRGAKIADWVAGLGLSKNKQPKPSKLAKFPHAAAQLGRDELNRRLMAGRLQGGGASSKSEARTFPRSGPQAPPSWPDAPRPGGPVPDAPRPGGPVPGAPGPGSSFPRSGPQAPPSGPSIISSSPRPAGNRSRPGQRFSATPAPTRGAPAGNQPAQGQAKPLAKDGSAMLAAGKAVVRRRIGPVGANASPQAKVLRTAGAAASVLGGPAGIAGGFAADYFAERADQRYRARRIQVDSQGRAHVVEAKPEILEGVVVDRSVGPQRRPQPPSQRTQAVRERLVAARLAGARR